MTPTTGAELRRFFTEKCANSVSLSSDGCLLAAGVDINAGSGVNDWPPVIHAIHKHQLAALGHLLDRGAAVDAPLRSRALSVARGSGDEDAVLAILNAHRQPAVASAEP